MSWVKIDDQLHAHPKINKAYAACDASLGLHLMAMSYSACYGLHGQVDEVFVASKIPNAQRRRKAVNALVDAGLWHRDDEGWSIHDWVIYNGDATAREAARKAKVEAGRKGGRAKARNKQASSRDVAGASAGASSKPLAPSPSPNPPSSEGSTPEVDGRRGVEPGLRVIS